MQRSSTLSLSLAFVALIGLLLVGCDESPSSVQDFDVQPDLEVPSGLSLVLAEGSTSFSVSYQGLDESPQAEGTGALNVEQISESGTPSEGQQQWRLTYGESPDGIVTESVVLTSRGGGQEVVDSLSVTISRFVVSTSFDGDYATIADFEDEQRDSTALGGATMSVTDQVASGSNGVNALEVTDTPSGSVRIDRRVSAANANRFTFLVKSMDTFNLTFTFTEETGGGEATHQVTVPVQGSDEWTQYGIAFDQIGDDFNPVHPRAGGNGPLVSVEMSADANVTYSIDELFLARDGQPLMEIMDFERTGLAYGPPFCPPNFDATDDVDVEADGFTARTVQGEGCFGYNYNLKMEVTEDHVVSFRARASSGDSLQVFLEANGEGGYGTGSSVTVALPQGEWGVVEVPIESLGDNPSALSDPGISNVGFTAAGTEPDFAIDDIKIKAPGN
jgi:hypothetical protein